jgi:Skp family chaperone for outer membrane proteins
MASTFTVAIAVIVGAASILTILGSSSVLAQQAAPTVAPAGQAAGPVVIGIVDARALLLQSTAGKGLQTAVAQRKKQLSDDTKKREDAWVAQAKALEAQKATMTPQDYQAKSTLLGKQRDQIRTDIDAKARAADVQKQQAIDQIQAQALAIVKQIITQKGISLLLTRDAVVWANSSAIDITPDVLAQLNQKLPSVKF